MVALIAAALGWSVSQLTRPVASRPTQSAYVIVHARPGSVGQTIRLVASAEWASSGEVRNQAEGTVTTVDYRDGDPVRPGQTLYTIDLEPVVAAQGDVPSFRTLRSGVTGKDVAQWQALLGTLGFLSGPTTGRFDARTVLATQAWQRSIESQRTDGVVPLGSVLFLPRLGSPVRMHRSTVSTGRRVAAGESALELVAKAPRISLDVTETQDSLIGDRTVITLAGPGGRRWSTRVAARHPGEAGSRRLVLTSTSGGAACAATCSSLPVGRRSSLGATVQVVPTTTGLVVPTLAVLTDGDGRTVVVTRDGVRRPVTVVAEAQGRSIIRGVPEGSALRAPAERTGT